jgi:hypothetical protein
MFLNVVVIIEIKFLDALRKTFAEAKIMNSCLRCCITMLTINIRFMIKIAEIYFHKKNWGRVIKFTHQKDACALKLGPR